MLGAGGGLGRNENVPLDGDPAQKRDCRTRHAEDREDFPSVEDDVF